MKAVEGLEMATAGGHEDAVGVKIKARDLEKFKERFSKLVEDME